MTTSPAPEKAMDEKIDWLSGDGLAARKMTCKAHGTVDCSYCWKVNLRELRASPSGGDVGEIRKRHDEFECEWPRRMLDDAKRIHLDRATLLAALASSEAARTKQTAVASELRDQLAAKQKLCDAQEELITASEAERERLRRALTQIDCQNPHVETSERWRSWLANNNSDIGDIARAALDSTP